MCRTGGRRCPGCNGETARAAHNARRRRNRQIKREIVEEARKQGAGTQVVAELEAGPPDARTLTAHGRGARGIAAALDAEAAARDAGVVVVGSRGRTALREVRLGSTAMAVLHHVHRPVLVVPQSL